MGHPAGVSKRAVLSRVESGAEHGVGAPERKRVEDFSEICSFFVWAVGAGVGDCVIANTGG
jgi:hypothetical protein